MQAIMLPISILIVILYFYWIWRQSPAVFAIGSLFFVEIAWQFVSIIWIDCGTYISEQLRTSYFTGASIRYTLLIVPFAISFPYFIHKSLKTNKRSLAVLTIRELPYRLSERNIFCIIQLIVAYMLANLLISGTPLLTDGVSKSNFYSSFSKLPFCNVFQTHFLPFFMLFLGIRYGRQLHEKKNGRDSLIVAAAILLIQILMDNKFYGLYDYTLHFILPVFVINKRFLDAKKKKLPWKWILVALCAVGLLIWLCYTKYAATKENPVQFLLDRLFSLQSHTFWGVDLLMQSGELKPDPAGLFKEILAGMVGNLSRLDSNYGIARIMYMVTASTYADDMLHSGFLFAGSYMTVLMSYIGYPATFVFSLVLSRIIATVCAGMAKHIETNHYLILYLQFFIFRRFYEYFRVGNPAMVINWKFLLIYLFFGVLWWTCYVWNKRRGLR